MDEDRPSWLDHKFLAAALQDGEDKEPKVEIVTFSVNPAVQAGQNYCSKLYRIKIEYKTELQNELQIKSVIVKTQPTKGIMKEFLEERDVAGLEICLYRNILPKMYSLYNQDQITPKLFYSMNPELLILQDLNEEGYIMMDRLKQLDFDHCVAAVRTLAKFHAMSFAVHKQCPELIQNMNKGIVYINNPENKEKYSISLITSINGLANAVETWEGFERFGGKIRSLVDSCWERMASVFLPRNYFNVLNHGDSWSNNMLFKHDSFGKVIDCKLLDLQLCTFGTPAIDLQYFTWSSTNDDVRQNKLDEVYTVYLQTLNSTLEYLDLQERLSADQLYHELKSTEIYGFLTFSTVLPFTVSDPDNLVNLNECNKESFLSYDININPIMKNYYGKYFKRVACSILLNFEEKGFF